jgi:general secretion pathway protein K
MRAKGKAHRYYISTSALSNSKGMALVLTLMVIVLITAMVVEFSYGVYINTSALYNWQTAQRLSFVAKSAIQLTAKILSENSMLSIYTYPGIFMISHKNPFEDFEGIVSSRIEDENSKFNINSLVYPNGLLNETAYSSFVRLLHLLEIKPSMADRIVDWIDPDKEPRTEDSEDGSKNGFLDSVDEILLIPGIDKGSFDKLLPYITIYGNGLININGAEIRVLMSLSDSIDREMAERIVRYRELNPFENPGDIFKVAGFETIGQSLMGRITVKGTAFHVTSTATEGDIKRMIESLLEMTGGSPTIKYWKEI